MTPPAATAISILLVEDNPSDVALLREELGRSELGELCSLRTADSMAAALRQLEQERPDLILLDIGLPDGEGPELVRRIRTAAAQVPIVVVTGNEDEETCLACVRAGAEDCQLKRELSGPGLARALSFAMVRHDRSHEEAGAGGRLRTVADHVNRLLRRERLSPALRTELEALLTQCTIEPGTRSRVRRGPETAMAIARREGIVTASPKLEVVIETCLRVAPSRATVLLLGETGTGKDLLARFIHEHSGRPGRFVAVNCGAVPESLIESELFGHEKGSFTGAHDKKVGLFAHADGGTLFLDEVGDLPMTAQPSTLRALQERTIRPVGGSDEISVDVRLIAATSSPLDEAVSAGKFREDLLYRLDVIRIVVPPLRERPEDVLLLFGHFRDQLAAEHGLEIPSCDTTFIRSLEEYPWPGNVRQLQNFTERLLLTQPSRTLTAAHFQALLDASRQPPLLASERAAGAARLAGAEEENITVLPLDVELREVERRYLERALRAHRGCMQATAKAAGISRRTLLRKIKRHGLDRRDFM